MSIPRGGFWPVRHLNGGATFQTTRIRKDSTPPKLDEALIYVGDPVRVLSGKAVRISAADCSALSCGLFGVVARVLVNEDGRPRVHGLPDQHPNISLTADADWLDVYTDPGIVYSCRVAGSATNELIGSALNVASTARVTAAGISGAMINATAVSANTGLFVGVAVSNFDLDGGGSDAGGRMEVVMNYGPLKTAGTAPGA